MRPQPAGLSTFLVDQRFDPDTPDFRFNQAPDEKLFAALCQAYVPFGGIARADDLARLLDDWAPALADSGLVRLIAAKDIFHFEWRGAKWIPMAQFHLADMSLNVAVRQVRRELGHHLDGWEAACWFVQANEELAGRRPLDLMSGELFAVLQAARADRFIVAG